MSNVSQNRTCSNRACSPSISADLSDNELEILSIVQSIRPTEPLEYKIQEVNKILIVI